MTTASRITIIAVVAVLVLVVGGVTLYLWGLERAAMAATGAAGLALASGAGAARRTTLRQREEVAEEIEEEDAEEVAAVDQALLGSSPKERAEALRQRWRR